jgi:hypothetical protein
MEGEENKKEQKENHGIVMQTFKSDLSKAMNATEVSDVQDILQNAREREVAEKENEENRKKRSVYTFGGLLVLIVATLALLYAIYYYNKLTVPVQERYSVGIFQKSAPIFIDKIKVESVFDDVENTVGDSKPLVLSLVRSESEQIEINKKEFFDYLGAKVTEPFFTPIQVVRLGEVFEGNTNTPFNKIY